MLIQALSVVLMSLTLVWFYRATSLYRFVDLSHPGLLPPLSYTLQPIVSGGSFLALTRFVFSGTPRSLHDRQIIRDCAILRSIAILCVFPWVYVIYQSLQAA